MTLRQRFVLWLLRLSIRLAMGPDPHSGAEPNPDTVDALLGGLLARIAVSNARPVAYANEPWRNQKVCEHLSHAGAHVRNADAFIFGETIGMPNPLSWLSDLNQPEAAHAGLRLDFALWKFGRVNR